MQGGGIEWPFPQPNHTRSRTQQIDHLLNQRTFACAVASQQAKNLPLSNLQADVVVGKFFLPRIAFAQVLDVVNKHEPIIREKCTIRPLLFDYVNDWLIGLNINGVFVIRC